MNSDSFNFDEVLKALGVPSTATSSVTATCPACKAKNRVVPAKLRLARCGKCGMPLVKK